MSSEFTAANLKTQPSPFSLRSGCQLLKWKKFKRLFAEERAAKQPLGGVLSSAFNMKYWA
jgi:hypothetical protein